MSERYVVGDTVNVPAVFTVAGVATDPATVSLVVTDPTGTTATYTYAGGQITKDSTGNYHKDVSVTLAGVWSYAYTGASPAAGVQDGTVTVYALSPQTPGLYCTLDELKADKGLGDTTEDARLLLSIQAASRKIDGACGWRFWKDSAVVARTFVPDSPNCLYLADDPQGDGIASTSGLIVKLDTADSGSYSTTLTAGTDYILNPRNAAARNPAWPYTEITMTGVNYWFIRSQYQRALVQITALWGWPQIPDDIKLACLIQAGQLFKSKDAAFGVISFGGELGGGMRAQSWHPDAYDLIRPYQKPAVG